MIGTKIVSGLLYLWEWEKKPNFDSIISCNLITFQTQNWAISNRTLYIIFLLSPVNRALLFSHDSLQVGELQKAVMEVVQVENTHQQERGGDEDPGEKLGHSKLLQSQVLQAAEVKTVQMKMRQKEKQCVQDIFVSVKTKLNSILCNKALQWFSIIILHLWWHFCPSG